MKKFHRVLVFIVALLILYLMYRYSFEVDSDGNYLFLKPSDGSGSGSAGRGFLTLLQPDDTENLASRTRATNPKRLVNLTDFQFRIKNDICKENGSYSELLGVILITSYVGNDAIRSAHRQAISQQKLISMGMLRIFSLGSIPPSERFITQEAIEHEQHLFGDLIQGSFMEAYRNLTYKHVMSLKWTTEHCRKVKFLIKMDDDIVYDPFYIQNYLSDLGQQKEQRNLLAGFTFNNKKVIRLKANKWYVSREEFARDVYPPYLSGWLYITNQRTAHELVALSETVPFFWIDDTYVTGILAERAKIQLTSLNKWFSANSEFIDCCIRDMKRYSYQCDYYVGPNGGNSKLIMDFIQELERCYDNACYQRPSGRSLTATCVAEYKNIVQDHGTALINMIRLR
ncbi:beta-1,3-galactosyltransferase 5 [Toxorhynchites rutilus septentrionalis]|uniref:beta-1,3-galactosyltransferase 5 n=1 Tax=Toxorhynchites rutilus septentrionalis TaxID=329112 RepID=UPI0024797CAE|nr:beta-1,3-galactosyltransferase 5 [Toxorhynchites rutilus septentrionalis]XP_055638181.1 beta-1,3-galactosyltransferase 5 [Toxorhynchites rutilus septentrionalis]